MTSVQIPDELTAFTRQQTADAAVLKLAGMFDADPASDDKEQRRYT